jgi:hypothetical protein
MADVGGEEPNIEDVPLPELFRKGREAQTKAEGFASASSEAQVIHDSPRDFHVVPSCIVYPCNHAA